MTSDERMCERKESKKTMIRMIRERKICFIGERVGGDGPLRTTQENATTSRVPASSRIMVSAQSIEIER